MFGFIVYFPVFSLYYAVYFSLNCAESGISYSHGLKINLFGKKVRKRNKCSELKSNNKNEFP